MSILIGICKEKYFLEWHHKNKPISDMDTMDDANIIYSNSGGEILGSYVVVSYYSETCL